MEYPSAGTVWWWWCWVFWGLQSDGPHCFSRQRRRPSNQLPKCNTPGFSSTPALAGDLIFSSWTRTGGNHRQCVRPPSISNTSTRFRGNIGSHLPLPWPCHLLKIKYLMLHPLDFLLARAPRIYEERRRGRKERWRKDSLHEAQLP